MKLFKDVSLLLAVLLLSNCKKDSNNNYYLQADMKNTAKSFNRDAYAQEFFGDFTASFSVTGKTNTAEQLTLSINHTFNKVVTAGTYDKNTADELFLPGITYTINDTLVYSSGVKQDNPWPVTIIISGLTDKTATGKFSGIVYNRTNTADSIVITNGKFAVPVRK